jgi:diguanylate cyclase (GGDEF)-like protein/PAS domain S-box-containing protein
MGPTPSVPASVRRPESSTGRPVVLVVDPQHSLLDDLVVGMLERSSGVLDPQWPARTAPEVRTVRHRDEARRTLETEPVVAVVLILPVGDQQAHERTRDLRSVIAAVPLIVVHDVGSGERAEFVGRGADDAITRGSLTTALVPALVTELRRRRRTTLEDLVAAHLLVDVLAWESGYVLLDADGHVVESALQSGEPWFGGLTGLRAADLVVPGEVERFEGARRLAQQIPSVARTVVVEVVAPGPGRRWLEVSLVNVSTLSPLGGVVATHRDVSDQRRPAPFLSGSGPGLPGTQVMECLSEGVVVFGSDGRITAWNDAASRLLGTPVTDALAADIQDIVPHLRPPTPSERTGVPDVWVDEFRSVLSDGSEQVLERRFTRRWGEQGALCETVLVVSSATEARASAALARRFQAILDSSSEAILSKTTDGIIITWNGAAARMYGYTAEEAVGQHVSMLVPANRRAELATIMHRVLAGAGVERLETVRRRKDTSEAEVILNVSPLHDDDGNVVGAITVASDITEQRVAEAERELAEVHFDGMFRRSAFGMALADLVGRITVANPALCEMLGHTARELVGHQLSDFAAVGVATADDGGLPSVREGTDSYSDERRYRRPEEVVVWLQCNVTLIRGPSDEPLYLMVQALDITARKRIEMELEHRVLHDDLTGLPNRALLNDRLDQALASARRSGAQVGVVFLDVDGFKHVNDALGHGTGDNLLVELGHRLCTAVRPDDTVARFGGDEFVILCADVDIEETEQLAERIGATMSERFDVGGHEVEVHASLGITVSVPESTVQSILSEADAAMFRAKDLGRNRAAVFDDTLRARAVEFLDGEKALRLAIARRELVAYYQPIIDLASGRPIGVEALVRWVREDGGVIAPDQFIPLAEATGLIVRLGELVLLESAETVSKWNADGAVDGGLWVSVNLSARQLSEPSLVETVRHALESTGLPADRLHLEVTETVVMDDVRESIVRLDDIRGLGVRLSIDDFGTGHSSLAYLKQLPVDTLKIDRSFVDGVVDDPDDRTIVEAVVSLGRALGLTCLAEGVETPAQLEALVRMGCQLGQGYHWARPMPADEARRWFEARMPTVHNGGGTIGPSDVTES